MCCEPNTECASNLQHCVKTRLGPWRKRLAEIFAPEPRFLGDLRHATSARKDSNRFVASTAAPVATGWSESLPGGSLTR